MELTKEQELEQYVCPLCSSTLLLTGALPSTRDKTNFCPFRLIGYVSVNSGTIVVVDPCNLNRLVPSQIYFSLGLVEQAVQICEDDWKIAIASRTTGDGIYPVYGKYGKSPVSDDLLIEQLIIDFKHHPENPGE